MTVRGRPIKTRIVRRAPKSIQFSPRGNAGRPGYIELRFEEFEALRLNDYLGLSQNESAKFMNISQQTFSRILRRGRRALSEALVTGKIIRIKGGNYKII